MENQILKLTDYSIVFLSETCFVITKDVEKVLKTEKLQLINPNYRIRKSKSAVGAINFNVKVRAGLANVFVKDKKILLRELMNVAAPFEETNLLSTNKYICYKKNQNFYVAIPKGDYTYLNQINVIQRNDLGNIVYFRGMDKETFIEHNKILTKLSIPISRYIFDERLSEDDEKSVTYKNDLSPNNAFYFLDDNDIKLNNTGAKQVLTYGFSRNNTLNYFDINMSDSFAELKVYSNSDLNYNKNYFGTKTRKSTDIEYIIRYSQFNVFLPIAFYDQIEMSKIQLSDDDEYFNIVLRYMKLRHRLIPLLYGAFKDKRIKNIDPYQHLDNKIIFNNQLMFVPIFNNIDPITKQRFLNIHFEDMYFDFVTGEKFNSNTYQFYQLDTMPIFAKSGSIIPLAVLNKANKVTEYEMKIYPGEDNDYLLHYDEYIQNGNIKHANTRFVLDYATTKLVLTITPDCIKELLPEVFHINFVNIRSSSIVNVAGSEFKVDYNIEKKYLLIDILQTDKTVRIEITNPYGLELDRSAEFYNNKLETIFKNMKCSDKDYQLFKYKIRPYLHESLDLLKLRIDKHIKFLNKKQRHQLIHMLELYKK